MPLPTAQQLNLPACSPHCPFIAESQASKLWIPILKLLVWPDSESSIKPESTAAPEVDALTTRPSELWNKATSAETKRKWKTLQEKIWSKSRWSWPYFIITIQKLWTNRLAVLPKTAPSWLYCIDQLFPLVLSIALNWLHGSWRCPAFTLLLANSSFIRFTGDELAQKPIPKNFEFFMPGVGFKIFWGLNDQTPKRTLATRLNLASNDSEDMIFYLSAIHFHARSENGFKSFDTKFSRVCVWNVAFAFFELRHLYLPKIFENLLRSWRTQYFLKKFLQWFLCPFVPC